MKNKSILMSGYYGFDNSGDDAILKAIVKDLREMNKDIDIVVLSNNPGKTEKMYPVKAVNRFNLFEVIKAIRGTSLLISGGGSLLQDITSNRSLWYYLTVMAMAKFFGKKVMVYSNGIGPIDKGINRILTKWVLNWVDIISLRDEGSRKYVESMGIRNNKTYVTADPVFTLEPENQDLILDIFKKEKIDKSGHLIGISLREWKNSEDLEKKMALVVDEILRRYDTKVLFIPMHYPEDLNFCEKTVDLLEEKGAYILRDKYSVEEIMGIISELDLIVAMRLHSLIYAATQSIPMVGLVYDPKISGILESIGMKYMSHVEDLDLDKLLADIDLVWNNQEEIKKDLGKLQVDLRNKALKNVEMALDILK